MLSKKQIKLIQSLKQKKFRLQHNLFVAEGKKTISELFASDLKLDHLYTTTFDLGLSDERCTRITSKELERISFLSTAQDALALFRIPKNENSSSKGLTLALDKLNDPGNLGTMIRLADWFGIKSIICGNGTVDCYNPKVVQSSMGSLGRVNIRYLDLFDFLQNSDEQKIGTFMDAPSIYSERVDENAIIVLGNEANGISEEIEELLDKKISIPRYGSKTESLNVANAAAIILAELKRRFTET